MQRSQRLERGRNPLRRWRRHDHAVDAWRWRAEPVWVMAPRMIPTVMQARRVRVSNSPMAARQGRVRVPVPPVPYIRGKPVLIGGGASAQGTHP